MRTYNSSPQPHKKRSSRVPISRYNSPRILIVDSRKLRQAGIMGLLEAWADSLNLKVSAITPTMPLDRNRIGENCEMVIVSVGSASVEDVQQQMWIRSARVLLPNAQFVILSDREDAHEVCAAFEAGAAGFMPTSTEPMVALQALSFIRNGGSFFPPSALSHETAIGAPVTASDQPTSAVVTPKGKFTAKQGEVFKLLCQGHTNKLIARQLGMSEATVKVHVRRIMHKFGATNRTQAVISAMAEHELSR
jgi:DNA-binding NarL/FixJ family response regulator